MLKLGKLHHVGILQKNPVAYYYLVLSIPCETGMGISLHNEYSYILENPKALRGKVTRGSSKGLRNISKAWS